MAISFFSQDCDFLPQGRRKIAAWVKHVVQDEGFRTGDITYIFCSPEYHVGMNKQYLRHDYQTDVITFDYSGKETDRIISGDIFINPTRVKSQAVEWGTEPGEELYRVMIHGVLHLCGYDDQTDSQRMAMRIKEDACLDILRQIK